MSNTTLLFLKEAAKKRDFQVRQECLVQDTAHILTPRSYFVEKSMQTLAVHDVCIRLDR